MGGGAAAAVIRAWACPLRLSASRTVSRWTVSPLAPLLPQPLKCDHHDHTRRQGARCGLAGKEVGAPRALRSCQIVLRHPPSAPRTLFPSPPLKHRRAAAPCADAGAGSRSGQRPGGGEAPRPLSPRRGRGWCVRTPNPHCGSECFLFFGTCSLTPFCPYTPARSRTPEARPGGAGLRVFSVRLAQLNWQACACGRRIEHTHTLPPDSSRTRCSARTRTRAGQRTRLRWRQGARVGHGPVGLGRWIWCV